MDLKPIVLSILDPAVTAGVEPQAAAGITVTGVTVIDVPMVSQAGGVLLRKEEYASNTLRVEDVGAAGSSMSVHAAPRIITC